MITSKEDTIGELVEEDCKIILDEEEEEGNP